jgi:hydrogenase-4 component B
VLPLILHPVGSLFPEGTATAPALLFSLTKNISLILALCGGLVLVVALVKTLLDRKTHSLVRSSVTWDCGYSQSDPSIQYTASSFTDPIISFFKQPLAAQNKMIDSKKNFPVEPWSFQATVDDWFLSKVFFPVSMYTSRFFSLLRGFQSGKIEMYVLYIAITVLGLILWKFFL